MAFMGLHVDLTLPRVSSTCRRVELSLAVGSTTLLSCCCCLQDFSFFFFFFFSVSQRPLCFLLFLCFVDYCLLQAFYWFDPLVETFVTRFVLVPLSFTVPNSVFNSVFTTSAFWWLSLVPSESSDKFALICAHFAFVIVLCGHLR
jgi:hypothetical protein